MNSFDKANVNVSELAFFAHGSTVVINALTERKGVKTCLSYTHDAADDLCRVHYRRLRINNKRNSATSLISRTAHTTQTPN